MAFICRQMYRHFLWGKKGTSVLFLFCCVLIVPEEFMYNPLTRSYGEPHKRPEVQNSTVEFIASSDYMVNKTSKAIACEYKYI